MLLGSLGSAISNLDSAQLIAALSTAAILAIVLLMLVRAVRQRKTRMTSNAALDLSHEQATLDSLPAAVVVLDESGKVRLFNDAWHKLTRERAFGLSDGGKGRHYRQVLRTLTGTPESDPETTLEAGIRRVARSRDQRFDEDLLTSREGDWPWFHVYVRTMDGDANTDVLLMMVNISNRKRQEIDLDSTFDDLMGPGNEVREPGRVTGAGSMQRRALDAARGLYRGLLRYNSRVEAAYGALRTSPVFSQSI